MNIISGPASHVHLTIQVSRGGESRVRTTHICLFRIHGQQITFKASRPLSVADGDDVVVAGVAEAEGLKGYAVYNRTTGIQAHAGVMENLIAALIVPVFGVFFCSILSMFIGKVAFILMGAFLYGSFHLLREANRAKAAMAEVRAYRI